MSPRSTANAGAADQHGGAPGRSHALGRPATLWLVVAVFTLSGTMYLLDGGSTLHAAGESASMLAGIALLVIAGGLWFRQKWAILCAIGLQALGLLLALLTIDFPAIVVSIALLGTMFAIPRRVWY